MSAVKYVAQGDSVKILYEGKNRQTGLTVEGNFYRPNGTAYAANPFSFTHKANGVYELNLTSEAANGFHYGDIDATDVGQSRPGATMFRVENNTIQDIYDLVSTVDGKIDDIQGATFNTSTDSLEAIRDRIDSGLGATFNTSTDSNEAIRNALDAIDTKLSNIEGTAHAVILLEQEMEIPTSGTIRYQIDVYNYGQDGMKDFDAAPTLAVTGSDAVNYTTRLYDAVTLGNQTATMVQVGGANSGHYRLWFQVSNADTNNTRMYFVLSGTEDTESFTYQQNSVLLSGAASAGVAQEATLTTIKQKLAGTYDRETDSLEAIRDRMDTLDLELKQKAAGTYNRETDSQEAIRDRIDDGLGATFSSSTDSNEAIRNRLDVAMGATFNASTDTLEAIRNEIDIMITYSGMGVH